jgi:hypothetical protein
MLFARTLPLHILFRQANQVSLFVSAGFLHDFQASLAGPDITTAQLCESLIKPVTLDPALRLPRHTARPH